MAIEKQNLNKKEKAVMRAIFTEAKTKNGLCLLTPIQILSKIPYGLEFKEDELDPILNVLELEEYLDSVESDRKGELVYCITLHKRGLAFQRKEEYRIKSIIFKFAITIFFCLFGIAIKQIIGLFL